MRWNRMITSVCIFLLGLLRIITGAVVIGALVFLIIGETENSWMFSVEDYQFDETVILKPKASYDGVNYENVTVAPKTYTVWIEEAPFSSYLMTLPFLLIAVVLFYFLGLIIKLLKSIEEREFFSLANVKRLRIIGLMVLGSSVVQSLYSMILDYFLRNELKIEGFSKVRSSFIVNLDFLGTLWFLGLMILLMANAFEHGVRLKEEQELTI